MRDQARSAVWEELLLREVVVTASTPGWTPVGAPPRLHPRPRQVSQMTVVMLRAAP